LPCSNRSRTRDAPTPTNISTKSDPDIEKNGRPAEPLEFLRILEEIDDLFELLLRLVRAGHVRERHLGRVAGEQLRLRLTERKGAVPTLLHLTQHEDQQTENQQVREEPEQKDAERLFLLARPHVHALRAQRAHPRVARFERQEHGEVLGAPAADRDRRLEIALHLLPVGDLHRGNVALIQLLGELRVVGDLHGLLSAVGGEFHQRDGAHDQERPERQRPERPGPGELARRRDAVGHQVRLAT
jgi:hypothetical protein